MRNLLHKINFKEAMSRQLMVICSTESEEWGEKSNNWDLMTKWTKFVADCYIKVKIHGLRIVKPGKQNSKLRSMQSGKQNSELRNSKIMWQDIGLVIWTLSSWHETVTNGQLFILPRRQYRTTNIASVSQINIGKLIKKTKKMPVTS